MLRPSSPFTLDLRSIALFRALLGAIMLYDVVARLPYAALFLSDEGALSRADLLATAYRPWSFSVYMLVGEPVQVQVVLMLHGVAALALLLGFWTRLASVACWVMLVSLQHRNPLVLNGGDTLLTLFAFWAMFLPLNARWSMDRALARRGGGVGASGPVANAYHAVPGAALVMQIVLVYVFTWYLKEGDLWRSGDAVGYVVRNTGLISAGGAWFQQYDSLHPFFTRLTYHWEWIGCALALCPFANAPLRMLAICGFTLMHLGFALTLDLALFPAVSISGWLVLLPTAFWDAFGSSTRSWKLSERARELGDRVAALPWSGGRVVLPGRAASVCCAVAIGLVLLWNLRGLPDSRLKDKIPEPVENLMYTLKLRQKWSMFAANPPRNSNWYAIEAQMANGDTVDLFHPREPYTLRPPEVFMERLPDRRWGKFLGALKKSRYARLRDGFLEYFVTRWNRSSPSDRKIAKASLVHFRAPIRVSDVWGPGKPATRTLETVYPAGVIPFRGTIAGYDEGDLDEEEEEDL